MLDLPWCVDRTVSHFDMLFCCQTIFNYIYLIYNIFVNNFLFITISKASEADIPGYLAFCCMDPIPICLEYVVWSLCAVGMVWLFTLNQFWSDFGMQFGSCVG